MNQAQTACLNRPILSARLQAVPACPEHAPLMFTGLSDPQVYRWISTAMPKSVADLAATYERTMRRLQSQEDMTSLNWSIRRLIDGVWIGKLDVEINSEGVATNVGYLFFSPFWGQGYATEAVTALSDHLYQEGIADQCAYVTAGNVASERVLVKSGFLRSRILRDNDTLGGIQVDDIEYLRGPAGLPNVALKEPLR
jgi:ribosomal-protein-alanine N-acetyltransferase